MTIVHRRIFYGKIKIGKAHEIIQHIREGDEMLRSRGYEFPSRVLADFQSGRTDRVAVEWRAERVGEFEEAFEGQSGGPGGPGGDGPLARQAKRTDPLCGG